MAPLIRITNDKKGHYTLNDKLLDMIQKGDTLVVTKLHRLALSALNEIETIRELFEKGVLIHILNMGIVEDTPQEV